MVFEKLKFQEILKGQKMIISNQNQEQVSVGREGHN